MCTSSGHSTALPIGLLPYTSLPNTAYLLLSLGWAYPNSELWQKWLPSFLVTVDRRCSWPTFKWNHYAIEQGLPQTLTVKAEKTRRHGGSSAKIRPQLQKLWNQGNTQHCISLSFHLFLHSFTLRLVDLSPCRPLEIVLGNMDLQGPGPYRSRKIIYSFGLTRLAYLTTIVLDSGIWSSKNNPFLPANPTLLRAAWDHPSLCERVPNLDSTGSC